MRCSHCQSMMFETQTAQGGNCEQTWYECPACGSTHLLSRYVRHPAAERFHVPAPLTGLSTAPVASL